MHALKQLLNAGEKAVEALAGYERSTIGMFKTAAAKLIEDIGSPEDAVAMALAKITGLSTLRVSRLACICPPAGIPGPICTVWYCQNGCSDNGPFKSFCLCNHPAV